MQPLDYATPTELRSGQHLQRAIVFTLAATSIWSLLGEFYGLMSMRTFALWICVPSMIALLVWGILDRGQIRRIICVGALAGFIGACAYDVFRLPFVFAKGLHIDSVVPALPLFKVFPEFGRMIFGTNPWDVAFVGYFRIHHLIGWAYHFSNGITLGIMYLALIGNAARRSWWWAIAFSVGLETALLVTPYASFFGIQKTPAFVAVTLSAHIVFGVAMGLCARTLWRRRHAG